MKKYFVLFLLLFFIPITESYAITPTPTEAPKATDQPKAIDVLNDLKDKIASRVAQLNLVEKKGLIGTVDTVSGTQITVTDIHGNSNFVDVDELTKFSSPSAKTSFGLSDLTAGSRVDILGLYNKQSKRILARFITVTVIPQLIVGEISSLNTTDFSLMIISDTGTLTPVDVETVTKTQVYTKGDNLQKIVFSKIEQGKQIVVIGYPSKQNAKRIVASRIIVFPDLPQNPRIIIPQPAINPDTTTIPSTGSGKKLTPLTQ